jgi:hypothetical protein
VNHDNAITDVPFGSILIGERQRKDMGDLDALAASIVQEGLLQPIGITEENILVFGERRLLAIRDVLKRPSIAARVVRVSSILAGEFAENEVRKNFTPSERVAIGKAIEALLGNRQGQRTDRELPRNCGEVTPGLETREIAARKAGFDSKDTYERAKTAVEVGTPELIEAMDAGEVSISAASVIACEPPELQDQIVRMPGDVRRQVVRELREAAKLPTPAEARRLARKTGMAVADNTGVYRSGASAEEVREAKADAVAIYTVTRGILAIADTAFDPDELASRLDYWHCPDIRSKSLAAHEWLSRFVKGLESNAKIQ